jgi:hypothetical protein
LFVGTLIEALCEYYVPHLLTDLFMCYPSPMNGVVKFNQYQRGHPINTMSPDAHTLLPPLSRSILSPVLRVGFDRPDPAPLTAGSLAGWCRDGSEARLPPCSSSFRIRCSLWVNPVFPLVESEGRPVAIVGRSHRVSSQPPPSSFRWWQVVRQMELADSCIPLNKAESASYSLAHPSCAKRLRFFFFFLVVLSWAEPVPGRRR